MEFRPLIADIYFCRRIGAAVALMLSLAMAPALADGLSSGLSEDTIAIDSSFTGTTLTVFGAVEPGAPHSDVAVVVRGPGETMTVRRKARLLGLWINRHKSRLEAMPGYYFAASTRPLERMASAGTRTRYQLGLASIRPAAASTKSNPETAIYTAAAVREETLAGIYGEDGSGVQFLSPTLFRASIPVPADAPRGTYTATVYLLKDGGVAASRTTPFHVDQTGLERQLNAFAHHAPFAYGLGTVAMALSLGWLSSLAFRKR